MKARPIFFPALAAASAIPAACAVDTAPGWVTLPVRAPGVEFRTLAGVAAQPGWPAPTIEAARKIRTPFLMLHGNDDRTVRPGQSAWLKEALDANHVANERHVFEGAAHDILRAKPDEMYRLLREWFTKNGVLAPAMQDTED